MFKGMTDSTLGIWVAHGEGRLHFPDPALMDEVLRKKLVPVVFVDDEAGGMERFRKATLLIRTVHLSG